MNVPRAVCWNYRGVKLPGYVLSLTIVDTLLSICVGLQDGVYGVGSYGQTENYRIPTRRDSVSELWSERQVPPGGSSV